MICGTDHLARSFNRTTPGSKSLENRGDIITNSLAISGCGGWSMAVVYITSPAAQITSGSKSVGAVR